MLAGAKFLDGIAPAWFFTDLHDPPPGYEPHGVEYIVTHRPPPGDWYEIPYRCLPALRPAGLLVAGPCISCDRPAQGSLRVMPTCFFLGHAAETTAARAIGARVHPPELDGAVLEAELLADCHPPLWP